MAQKLRDPELPFFAEAKRINDPERALEELAKEASTCTRCPLYKNATQTVFGEGPARAALAPYTNGIVPDRHLRRRSSRRRAPQARAASGVSTATSYSVAGAGRP